MGRGIAVCLCVLAHWTEGRAEAAGLPASSSWAAESLVVVTWNVEWFGHPSYPPENDALQIINVASVLAKAQAHVYALQEVSSVAAFQQLLSLLGPPYAGVLANADGPQRLALVYDSDVIRVQSITDRDLEEHSHSFGGRPPLIMHAIAERIDRELSWTFINVHMKAFFDPDSRARRAAAASALKAYLDRIAIRSRTVVLGDFNDDFVRSADADPSPYAAILLDSARYAVPTTTLSTAYEFTFCANADCSAGSVIDHVVVSRPLAPRVTEVKRMKELLSEVGGFVSTTSDHLPVQVSFRHTDAEASDPSIEPEYASIRVLPPYPNPCGKTLTVPIQLLAAKPVRLFAMDVLGRARTLAPPVLRGEGVHHLPVSVRGFPAGIWLVCAATDHERTCSSVSKAHD